MPYVDVVRKDGVWGLPVWDGLSSLVKSIVASGINKVMMPETPLQTTDVHVYGSDKDGCPDAPGLLVNIDFNAGTQEQNDRLRELVLDNLKSSRLLTHIKVGVYIRPVIGASFDMREL